MSQRPGCPQADPFLPSCCATVLSFSSRSGRHCQVTFTGTVSCSQSISVSVSVPAKYSQFTWVTEGGGRTGGIFILLRICLVYILCSCSPSCPSFLATAIKKKKSSEVAKCLRVRERQECDRRRRRSGRRDQPAKTIKGVNSQ